MKVLIIEPGRAPRTETLDPAEIAVVPTAPRAPDAVPAWAAKAILHEAGLLTAAEAAAAGAGGAWPFRFAGAATWARADVQALAMNALGLSEQQVDEMLMAAAALATSGA